MILSEASRDCDGTDENVWLILVRNRYLWRAECTYAMWQHHYQRWFIGSSVLLSTPPRHHDYISVCNSWASCLHLESTSFEMKNTSSQIIIWNLDSRSLSTAIFSVVLFAYHCLLIIGGGGGNIPWSRSCRYCYCGTRIWNGSRCHRPWWMQWHFGTPCDLEISYCSDSEQRI